MPELPEVQVVVNGLSQNIIGKSFKAVKINKASVNFSEQEFTEKVNSQKVKKVRRIGKMIVIHLTENLLVFHLKMTGQLIYEDQFLGGHTLDLKQNSAITPFTRLIFTFTDKTQLIFNDQRRFGYCHLIKKAELSKYRQKYGMDPVEGPFEWKDFWSLIQKHPHASFKGFLLNQQYIAGIGNIYADEIAFACRIHPLKRVGQISENKWKKVHRSIPEILRKSIEWNGTTFSHFLASNGDKGNFKPFLKVYGRAGEPCARCQTKLSKIKAAGRGTVFCGKCQKK